MTFWLEIITLTRPIRRGLWNLPHKFHLYLITYYYNSQTVFHMGCQNYSWKKSNSLCFYIKSLDIRKVSNLWSADRERFLFQQYIKFESRKEDIFCKMYSISKKKYSFSITTYLTLSFQKENIALVSRKKFSKYHPIQYLRFL